MDSIPLQVRDAYGAVLDAHRNVDIFGRAHQVAKKMLFTAVSNSDVGLGEPRDLADGLTSYARTRVEYLQALFGYVYGLEQLQHAAGLDVEEVRRLSTPPPARSGPVTIIGAGRAGGSG
jgi:hypothetical protein